MRTVFKWIAELRAADETMSVCFSQYIQQAGIKKKTAVDRWLCFCYSCLQIPGASILTLYVRRKKELCISRMCKNPGFEELLGFIMNQNSVWDM